MEKTYTPKEIADNLRIKPDLVYRWLKSGKLEGFRLGHKTHNGLDKRPWRVTETSYQNFVTKMS